MFEELRIDPEDERKNYVDLNIHEDGQIVEGLRIVIRGHGESPDIIKGRLSMSKVGTTLDIKKVAEYFGLAYFLDEKSGRTRIFYKEAGDESEASEEESSEEVQSSSEGDSEGTGEVDLP